MRSRAPISLLLLALAFGLGSFSPQWTARAWAHGEDRPGPHGGVIRMPGAFHSEVKPATKDSIRVWLLDMEWRHPVVERSWVEGRLERQAKESLDSKPSELKMQCSANRDHFLCRLPAGEFFRKGDRIRLKTSRLGQPSAEVSYDFPFQVAGGSGHGPH